jgi:hypothetical protein
MKIVLLKTIHIASVLIGAFIFCYGLLATFVILRWNRCEECTTKFSTAELPIDIACIFVGLGLIFYAYKIKIKLNSAVKNI